MIDMSCPPEFNLFGSPHLIILLIWLKFKFNLKLRHKMMMDMFLPARIQLFASSAFNQPLLVQIHQDVLSAPSFARNQRSRERKRSWLRMQHKCSEHRNIATHPSLFSLHPTSRRCEGSPQIFLGLKLGFCPNRLTPSLYVPNFTKSYLCLFGTGEPLIFGLS